MSERDPIKIVARAICTVYGDRHDGLPCECQNGDMCASFVAMSQAAISAYLSSLKAQGMVVVPREAVFDPSPAEAEEIAPALKEKA